MPRGLFGSRVLRPAALLYRLQLPVTRNATCEFILARLSPRSVMTSFCLPGVITLCIKTCPHGFDNATGATANGK